MMFVQPIKLISPYSGGAAMPKISQFTQGDKIYEQAVWSDGMTGQFIKRGIVSIKDKATGKVINDWTGNSYNCIPSKSYRR